MSVALLMIVLLVVVGGIICIYTIRNGFAAGLILIAAISGLVAGAYGFERLVNSSGAHYLANAGLFLGGIGFTFASAVVMKTCFSWEQKSARGIHQRMS